MIFIFDLQGASYFIRGLCGIRSGACCSERWRNCKLCLRFYCFCGKNVNFVARKILLVMESKLTLYNTLDRRKETFEPINPPHVGMYVCGPTVYNFIHIGNARPMIVFDTVRRYLEYKGYDVNYVSNFTDVDDKIIKKAIEEGVTAEEISKRYIKECKKDMAGMNIKPATTHPLATQEIDGMIDMIKTLIDKGYAYEKNGTVYYRTLYMPARTSFTPR